MKNNQLPKLEQNNEDNGIYKYSKYTGKHIVPCCFRYYLFLKKNIVMKWTNLIYVILHCAYI